MEFYACVLQALRLKVVDIDKYSLKVKAEPKQVFEALSGGRLRPSLGAFHRNLTIVSSVLISAIMIPLIFLLLILIVTGGSVQDLVNRIGIFLELLGVVSVFPELVGRVKFSKIEEKYSDIPNTIDDYFQVVSLNCLDEIG
jgi:hypothetical protein